MEEREDTQKAQAPGVRKQEKVPGHIRKEKGVVVESNVDLGEPPEFVEELEKSAKENGTTVDEERQRYHKTDSYV